MNSFELFGIKEEDIARRAYSKYRLRQAGHIEGTAEDDWMAAEKELLQEHGIQVLNDLLDAHRRAPRDVEQI